MHPAMPSQHQMVASNSVKNLNGTDPQDRMATRQERIGAFTHDGVPPADQPFELLCEDHVGTYVVPVPMEERCLAKRGDKHPHRSDSGWLARALKGTGCT
jgi:hypothetical protein